MNISIITAFANLYEPFLTTSLIGRAHKKGLINHEIVSLLSLVKPGERIDAPVFGHGAGMLIKPLIVEKAITEQEQKYGTAHKVFFSPRGTKLTQHVLKRIAKKMTACGHLMLLPARYEGMDTRIEDHYADDIISIGDAVLMGGDLPAMMLLEGVLRLIPGIVGKNASVEEDSFSGALLDYPAYTEPVQWKEHEVPAVVRSGNHAALGAWRKQEAARLTAQYNFDWFRSQPSSKEERALVHEAIPTHYIALLHGEVLIGPERIEGTTSVTSVDIHDISRSAKTYGLAGFFIVTPLIDQQKIVKKLLSFWHEGPGLDYNASRYEAVKLTQVMATLTDVIAHIQAIESKKPVVIATSARTFDGEKTITYHDHERVWSTQRPVLLVLGTGRGLAPTIMDQADFILKPLEGLGNFNHLSVRSAAAIILDRWLGLQPQLQ